MTDISSEPAMAPSPLAQAAALIAQADGLLVTAGAGMGVDSGLPDFRGPEGFWQAYPAQGQAHGAAVFTTNVDGHFQKAGFDPACVYECHGSIHHLQ